MFLNFLKRVLAILFLPTFVLGQSSSLNNSTDNSYKIIGHIKGLKEGEKVIMKLISPSPTLLPVNIVRSDSAYVKNGEFVINGVVSGGLRCYEMDWEEHPHQFVFLVINRGEQIHVHYDAGNIEDIKHGWLQHYIIVDGSPSYFATSCLFTALEYQRSISGQCIAELRKIKDSVGFDPKLVEPIIVKKYLSEQAFYWALLRNPEPDFRPALPYLCSRLMAEFKHPAFLTDVYNNLPEDLKTCEDGKALKEYLPLCVGQSFPDFTLSTKGGSSLSLRSVLSQSKLTIVQFWAYNSYDVDKYQKELQVIYKKYHSRGLNIIGISSDTQKNKWEAGIISNGLPWYQVSDLKGNNGVVGSVYHEYGNPEMPNTTNVLIDDKGKIVAWDVDGLELQYYLWKAFDENAETKSATKSSTK